MKYSPRLELLTNLAPALYNPRETDPYRLRLLQHSLSRLGWLLPLYGVRREDGKFELISGHQRSLAAESLGYEAVPFIELPEMAVNKRKAVNILFNRGTNDFSITENSNSSMSKLDADKYEELVNNLPVKSGHYPCLHTKTIKLKKIWDANSGRSVNYARNTARALFKNDVVMPIILEEDDLQIVNGIGRIQYLLEKGVEFFEAVFLSSAEAELARLGLNLISMNFTLEKHYEDHLRFSSFRRARATRASLGRGFVFKLVKTTRLGDFDISKPEHKALWAKNYGQSVLDFGAGHLTESKMLENAGFSVVSFEPYRVIGNEVSKTESLKCVELFLSRISAGVKFDSIFISSVLNSVPFKADREHIIQICSALCTRKTTLYVATMHEVHANYQMAAVKEKFNATHAETLRFKLEYEPGIILGDFNESPKVQKYHTTEELYQLIKTGFSTVSVKLHGDTCCAMAKNSIWTPEKLRQAIEFEFNLPYPDGSRMGKVDQAIAAFESRLKIKL